MLKNIWKKNGIGDWYVGCSNIMYQLNISNVLNLPFFRLQEAKDGWKAPGRLVRGCPVKKPIQRHGVGAWVGAFILACNHKTNGLFLMQNHCQKCRCFKLKSNNTMWENSETYLLLGGSLPLIVFLGFSPRDCMRASGQEASQSKVEMAQWRQRPQPRLSWVGTCCSPFYWLLFLIWIQALAGETSDSLAVSRSFSLATAWTFPHLGLRSWKWPSALRACTYRWSWGRTWSGWEPLGRRPLQLELPCMPERPTCCRERSASRRSRRHPRIQKTAEFVWWPRRWNEVGSVPAGAAPSAWLGLNERELMCDRQAGRRGRVSPDRHLLRPLSKYNACPLAGWAPNCQTCPSPPWSSQWLCLKLAGEINKVSSVFSAIAHFEPLHQGWWWPQGKELN